MANRQINVLRVITWLPIGGIERRLVALLPRIDRERFNVRVLCIRERGPLADELQAAGIPVDLIPFASRWDTRALLKMRAYLREHAIDIVHSHMYRANVPATVAARMAGLRRVWCQVHNVHSWDTARQVVMDANLCRWRSGMIAVSERVREDIVRNLNLDPARVRIIHNGVDTTRFASARQRRDEMRGRLRVDAGDTVLIFAHRLVEQKRCRDFLDAFIRLQRDANGESLRAWILGVGPLEKELRQQAAAATNPGAIRFFGQCDNVEDYLAAADIYVLPSTREGFSNGLVEAMAAGLSCVATDVGGNAEAVVDGEHGCIVPPLDLSLLTAAIKTLWHDKDLRQRAGHAAARRALDFSLDRMLNETHALYEQAMTRS